MTRREVDTMMADYKFSKCRCKTLEVITQEERKQIAAMRSRMLEDAVTIGGQDMDGMPHGTDVHSTVESTAIRFADGYTPDYIVEAEKKLQDHEDELQRRMMTVLLVEGWIEFLTQRERFVIMAKTIEGMYWRDIIARFNDRFQEGYSKSGLMRVKDRAMEKIYEIAA